MSVRVKLFDEEHEQDLEEKMNDFLESMEESRLIEIKYEQSVCINDEDEQIFCFSAMIVYRI